MGDWQLSKETREVIKWLRGPEGRAWSRQHHHQTAHAVKWFTFKADNENGVDADDDYSDILWVDLGRYDKQGQRFIKKNRYEGMENCTSYYEGR